MGIPGLTEARSYANRTDMKIIIQRLIGHEKMSNDPTEVIGEFSKYFSINVDYMKYKFRSNYVPPEVSMSMK